MQKIIPCLWFDDQAEPAARFYTSLLPDSGVGKVVKSPVDTPSGPAGKVLIVEFSLLTCPNDVKIFFTTHKRPYRGRV